jgi:uroporphyrinogen decarboxylase
MTSYERVINAINGRIPDRTPVAPEVFGITARISGYSIYEYVTDGKVIAESQLKAREAIGYDILFAFADLSVEAESLGCTLHYEKDAYPSIKDYILKRPEDVDNLDLPVPTKEGRMPVVLEACGRLRAAVDDECLIAACVMGPFSIASQILGLEKLLYQLVDNPDGISNLLDFTEMVAVQYGKALVKAGAHCPVVFDPVVSPAVLPPSMFASNEVPRLRRMFDAFKKEGALVSWISIAGPTQKILPYFKEAGINLATVDYVVNISEAFEVVDQITINGNIKPYSFITDTPIQIKESVRRCLSESKGKTNYIIGSGCEVPLEADVKTLIGMVEAAEEFRTGR